LREPLVLFQWGVSSYFGWGVYGLNMMLAWADRTDLLPATLQPIDPGALDLDPLERRRLAPAIARSAEMQAELRAAAGQTATTSRVVLEPLDNNLAPVRVAHDVVLRGSPSVGVGFHLARLTPDAREALRRFPLVIAGSTWNRDLLEQDGAARVELVLQGVDTSLFHPAPRRGLFADRFVVFSGGKLEYRKGQDLVIQAFRRFAARHPEALLLTAWGSPWPDFARSLAANPALTPPGFTADGQVDADGWTRQNGLSPAQVLHCGAVPNRAMARVLREADVALMPSRAEGGTNLVAMECMACGVPTILSANTGHLDLLDPVGDPALHTAFAGAIPLRRQYGITAPECTGWGESDLDEMVAALEAVHQDRAVARGRAEQAAAGFGVLSWAAQMDRLAGLLLPLMPPG
jgi:glycosyltransferase involved in cell wall biosynthesis